MYRCLCLISLASLVLAACSPPPQENADLRSQVEEVIYANGLSAMGQDWHEGAVFMEIYVRAYKDSDGDGIGDFNGLTAKLDYLADLGIRGIWLMPVNRSADRNHGYQVAHYREVEPDYGTRDDFLRLLNEAHKRNIGVVMDYLINHCAEANPIFQAALSGDPAYQDWFIWSAEDLQWKGHTGYPSWHAAGDRFYYGVFSSRMPDFNLLNEEVIHFHQNNLRYWMNLGVDGFRFDAVSSLVENGRDAWKSQEDNHAVIRKVKRVIQREYENRYLICEEDDHPLRFAQEDSCESTFAFGLNNAIFTAVKEQSAAGLARFFRDFPLKKMGIVLANHDSFAGDRPIEQLEGDLKKYRAVAATQLLAPGRPFIFYGEEIGIARTLGHEQHPDDTGLRPPMSWTADGGFTTAASPFRPHARNVAEANVADQLGQPFSLLSYYQQLIRLRNNSFALRLGNAQLIEAGKNLVYARRHFGHEAVVAVNYSGKASLLFVGNERANYRVLFSSEGRKSWDGKATLAPYEVLVLGP